MPCSGTHGRHTVPKASYADAVRILKQHGLPPDMISVTSWRSSGVPLQVMHILDPTYFRCRECNVYMRHGGGSCPCCGTRLSISTARMSTAARRTRVREIAHAVREAIEARKMRRGPAT